MKRLSLSRFEAAAQQLVEGSFSRLFGRTLEPLELARRCVSAAEGWTEEAPVNYFRIAISPDTFVTVAEGVGELAEKVRRHLPTFAERGGVAIADEATVVIEADPMVGSRHIEVTAAYVARTDQFNTAVMQREQAEVGLEALQALDAFLIVQGRHHVALDRPVTRIGRRIDNDIVLDSPAVSRLHAQIRWRDNFFVLYDVSGRGRTQVNGETTREHVLRPGDVIALSDVMLIYGEGSDQRGNGTPKQELTSSMTLTRDER